MLWSDEIKPELGGQNPSSACLLNKEDYTEKTHKKRWWIFDALGLFFGWWFGRCCEELMVS